jgi:methylated-DNA-protein-cysteine methyltransferase-like protein
MSKFKQKVIEITHLIPKGKVASYGQIALLAGVPRGARQVGWVLFSEGPENKETLPWWRIINNEGKISIKNPKVSPLEQKHLLEKEHITVSESLTIDIEKYRWRPDLELMQKLLLEDEVIEKLLRKYGM